jgi:hypothetical protein
VRIVLFALLFGLFGCVSRQAEVVEAKKPAPMSNSQALSLYAPPGKTAVVPTGKVAGVAPRIDDAGDDASEVLAGARAGMHRCVERSLTAGEFSRERRLDVYLNIDEAGKVTRVAVSNAPAGSSLPTCLKGYFTRLNFPRAGKAVSLNFPLVVTPIL